MFSPLENILASLLVPPTFILSENPEVSAVVKQRAVAYQNTLLAQLGLVNNQQVTEIKFGAYRGMRVYPWNQPFDAYLATYFLFNVGEKQTGEFLQAAALIRYKDCLQLGAIWKFNEQIAPFAIPDSVVPLTTFVSRKFTNFSPVKLNTFYDFRAEDRIQNILDLFIGEKLSEKGILNITNLSRIVCKGKYQEQLKSPEMVDFPSKAHRLVQVTLKTAASEKKKAWPVVTIQSQLNSGVFAQKNKDLYRESNPQPVNPEVIAKNIVDKLIPELHDLSKEEFKVIRRYRGWIYLDKGRAFGLQIGMRLIGPEDSRIHIIRFLPQVNGEIDSCIAFIRYEDEKRPIKVGDILKIDQTTFPKKKQQQ